VGVAGSGVVVGKGVIVGNGVSSGIGIAVGEVAPQATIDNAITIAKFIRVICLRFDIVLFRE